MQQHQVAYVRQVKFNGVVFELPTRYSITKLIGQGAYGMVMYVVEFFVDMFCCQRYFICYLLDLIIIVM